MRSENSRPTNGSWCLVHGATMIAKSDGYHHAKVVIGKFASCPADEDYAIENGDRCSEDGWDKLRAREGRPLCNHTSECRLTKIQRELCGHNSANICGETSQRSAVCDIRGECECLTSGDRRLGRTPVRDHRSVLCG